MPEPSNTTRYSDLALAVLFGAFVWSVWPTLSTAPLGLDDQALIASFSHRSFARVWGFDHFGHLRPIKNLYFWCLAQRPELISGLRMLSVVAAVVCAWLVRSMSLKIGVPQPWAAVAGTLWLFNPTTPVGVAWLAASNYLFALLGILLYLLALERAGARRKSVWWLGHAALLFAVLSHELAILAPAWLLLRHVRERKALALFAGAAAVSIVPIALRLTHVAPELVYRSSLPPAQLTASAAYNLARNVKLWLWLPGNFGVLLSQTAALEPLVYIGAWIAALALGALLWRLSHSDAWLTGALAWMLLFLLPLINLVPLGVTPVAMHYLILPGVGLAWLAARALAELSRRFPRQNLGLWIGVAVLLSWQPAFRHTLEAFRTDIGLYEASLANYPDNMEVRVNLIAAYTRSGATTQAQQLLETSLERAPQHPGLLELQLQSLVRGEQTNEALAWLDLHADLTRSNPSLSLHRALVLQKLGRTPEAEQAFLHVLAIATQPDLRALAGYQLANLLVQARRLHEAQALLRKLHAELPDNADITLALRLLDDVVH